MQKAFGACVWKYTCKDMKKADEERREKQPTRWWQWEPEHSREALGAGMALQSCQKIRNFPVPAVTALTQT